MPRKSQALDKTKQGLMIAIDPASYETGVALFSLKGELLGQWQLSTKSGGWGERLCDLSCQFAELPIDHACITEIAIESLKGAANSPMLNCISGIFVQYLPNVILRTKSFITPSLWKSYVRKRTGEVGAKGYASLKKLGDYPPMTDDCADAVLIGLAFYERM